MKSDELTRDQLLNFFSSEKNLHEPLIQRKETAAWGFIIFYVASIWTLYNTFIEKQTLYEDWLIFSLIVVVLLGFVAFRFVHSQYASIYYRWAYTLAIDKTIYKLMKMDFSLTSLDFSLDPKTGRAKFLQKQLLRYLKKKQPFRGKVHPLKICLRFWLYPLYLLCAKFRNKKVVKLGNPAKQEASLYSIIVLVTMAYGYLVLRLIY